MTESRQQPHSDPLVTEHYRQIANETTPAGVDRAVLDRAVVAARPRYARLRMWSRPVGWAATIALSVAIVLQLTRAPETPVPTADPGREARSEVRPSAADELVPLESRMLREAEELARMQSGPQQRPTSTPAPGTAPIDGENEPVYCDAAARSTRSAWLQCIERLESDGLIAEAAAERRAFELAFPPE